MPVHPLSAEIDERIGLVDGPTFTLMTDVLQRTLLAVIVSDDPKKLARRVARELGLTLTLDTEV